MLDELRRDSAQHSVTRSGGQPTYIEVLLRVTILLRIRSTSFHDLVEELSHRRGTEAGRQAGQDRLTSVSTCGRRHVVCFGQAPL